MDAVTPESIDYEALQEPASSWSPEGVTWLSPLDRLDADHEARLKQLEQDKIDMYALYDLLLEGHFYEDHDESTRLVGALRRHLFRTFYDHRPGK